MMIEESDISSAQPRPQFVPSPALSMGLRSKRGTDWLGGTDPLGIPGLYALQMIEKNHLMETKLEEIFALHAAGVPATLEAASLITQIAGGDKLAQPEQIGAQAAFLAASRLIPEDILILVPNQTDEGGTEWRLQAGLLAFPGHWRLVDKMGGNLAAIHSPVPEFQEKLSVHVDRFFANLQIGALSWRQHWSVHRDNHPFAPKR